MTWLPRSIADLKDTAVSVVDAASCFAAWDGGGFKGRRDHGVGEAVEEERGFQFGGMTEFEQKHNVFFHLIVKINSIKAPDISGENTRAAKVRTLKEFTGLFPIKGDICPALLDSNYLGNLHAAK